MRIPLEIIPTAYNISKKVYEGKLTIAEGIKQIVGEVKINTNSARDYIYDFRYLKDGKRFSRTLNADSMNYFFEKFLEDYGSTQLENPLSALKQHIEYYEGKQNATMHQMRTILERYSEINKVPILISTLEQLTHNIETIENYLTEGTEQERFQASNLIKRGTCFLAYNFDREIRFAPSRFLGYDQNKHWKHSASDINGRETNKVINTILKAKPLPNSLLEEKYLDYCIKLGINPQLKGGTFGIRRKYWALKLEHALRNDSDLSGEFPEGKIVERMHKARERNSEVVELAKRNFKNKNGKLFCQACNFDFEKNYGDIGKDFIEGHHTIAVSEMPPDHRTKPEEIAMLCGNCHRMVHKKRPWLTMDELSKLLKK